MATDAKGFPIPPKITKEQKDFLQEIFPNDTTDPYEVDRRNRVLQEMREKLSAGEEVTPEIIAESNSRIKVKDKNPPKPKGKNE